MNPADLEAEVSFGFYVSSQLWIVLSQKAARKNYGIAIGW